jgi:hypothetical protein
MSLTFACEGACPSGWRRPGTGLHCGGLQTRFSEGRDFIEAAKAAIVSQTRQQTVASSLREKIKELEVSTVESLDAALLLSSVASWWEAICMEVDSEFLKLFDDFVVKLSSLVARCFRAHFHDLVQVWKGTFEVAGSLLEQESLLRPGMHTPLHIECTLMYSFV